MRLLALALIVGGVILMVVGFRGRVPQFIKALH